MSDVSELVHVIVDEVRRRQIAGEPTCGWSVPNAPRPVDAPAADNDEDEG